MKLISPITAVICSIVVLSSCNIQSGSEDSLLPRASGDAGEIILVMDTLHKNSPLGQAIKETFSPLVEGLPRPEPLFNVRYIKPLEFRSILKNAQNIIIVSVLNNNSTESERVKKFFTPNSLKIIKEDSSMFLLPAQNEWARGQEVLYLFGKDEEYLTNKIIENRDQLRAHYNNIEKRRLMASLYKAKELKEVGNQLLKNHQFSMRVPYGWRIDFEDDGSNFVWLRNPGLDIDKSIWIYYKDYTSSDIFEEVIDFRNEVTKKYIYDDKESNDTSYVVVETLVPPLTKRTSFNSKYAVEARGLWKTNNLSMGGPFVSYVFVDEALGRVYFLDGFVYSPGKDQRESVRELETILWTFKTESEIPSS